MSRCTSEDWLAYGKLLNEFGGVESRVDNWISRIVSDDFSESDCSRDLASLISQFDHLAATAFLRPQLDETERHLGLMFGVDYNLDHFAAAIGHARQAISGVAAEDG